jgi:hypothetical protein
MFRQQVSSAVWGQLCQFWGEVARFVNFLKVDKSKQPISLYPTPTGFSAFFLLT